MGSCAAPSAKGDDKFITTDYLQQCQVNAIVSKLIQENQLKAYDDDVLKNLLNGWFMHIAIHAKNLKELADKKGQFIAIYRGFLLSLKDK
ncbi:hypothetical protein EWK47_24230 [Salmonella enterica subsp. enterica]|nr:hypothetical protein [Salmonella enterica subsp. enterica]ECF1628956.1 hypothetical protein [Salmonella enterica subsp. enterica]